MDELRRITTAAAIDNRETRAMIANSKWWAMGTAIAILIGMWQIATAIKP